MGTTEKRPGFIVYFETLDSLMEYTDEETGNFLRAAGDYARNGVVPDFQDRGLRGLWRRTMNDLDRDDAAYRKKCTDNRYNAYVSAEKRKFRREHPTLGEPKEGKDFLAKEEWLEQIDEATASDRMQSQAIVSEQEPTTTTAPAPKSTQLQQNSNINSISNVRTKGDTGETAAPPPNVTELQAQWKSAMEEKRMQQAGEFSNMLFRLGYVVDIKTGELKAR